MDDRHLPGRGGYFIDGHPIDRQSWCHDIILGHADVSDFGLSQGVCDRILDQNWKLILNQKVESAAWTHLREADQDFPVRIMTVDRSEVIGRPFDEIALCRIRHLPHPPTCPPGSPRVELSADVASIEVGRERCSGRGRGIVTLEKEMG